MKSRLLLSAVLAGLVLQPASAETQKAPVSPVVKKQVVKTPAAPAFPAKKTAASAKPAPVPVATVKPATVPTEKKPPASARPAPVPVAAVKPAAAGKKPLSLKALFSRKAPPVPSPPPAPETVAVAIKKSAPVKAKATTEPVPVIRRNTGEFINISFPEPRSQKSSATAANSARG